MAQSERDRVQPTFDLSDADVDGMFKDIATECRRPKLARATAAWDSLGDRYKGLGMRTTTG